MDPGIDGIETYRKICEIYPDQKALVVSGYPDIDKAVDEIEPGKVQFLSKPLTLYKLGTVVKEVIES
jgi:DNA-binding NtrC family response regulator